MKFYAKSSIKIQELIENLIIENFQIYVFFLFESGTLDSPGGPSSNRRSKPPESHRGLKVSRKSNGFNRGYGGH